jgi:hypothetical protein
MDLVTLPVVRDPGQTIVRVGVDVGQRQDYSAICVTEQESRLDLPHFLARSIERLPLGTPYPAVVDRVAEIMERLGQRAQPRRGPRLFSIELLLDATGVGLPIGDMLRERGLAPRLVLLTGSDTVNQQPQGVVTVGKPWMVGRMQVLLQSNRLHLPRTVEAGILVKELHDYRIEVNAHAHASFNAKAGAHDDLVIALGLSCGIEQFASRATSRSYITRDPDLIRDQQRAQRGRWARERGG